MTDKVKAESQTTTTTTPSTQTTVTAEAGEGYTFGKERLLIPRTNEPPALIIKDNWRIVAGSRRTHDSKGNGASRRYYLRVRRSFESGRWLVYGYRETDLQGERGAAAGYLLEANANMAEVIAKIHAVCAEIGAEATMAAETIHELPAVEVE